MKLFIVRVTGVLIGLVLVLLVLSVVFAQAHPTSCHTTVNCKPAPAPTPRP